MTQLRTLFATLLLLVAAACTTPPLQPPTDTHAQCPVCLCNADLACIEVEIAGDTPRCTCNGTTWYFCSDECRCMFEADPQRYLAR